VAKTFREADRRRALHGAVPAESYAFEESTLLQGLLAGLNHAEEPANPLPTAGKGEGGPCHFLPRHGQ